MRQKEEQRRGQYSINEKQFLWLSSMRQFLGSGCPCPTIGESNQASLAGILHMSHAARICEGKLPQKTNYLSLSHQNALQNLEGHLTGGRLFRYCWCLPQHPPLPVKSSPSIFHSCPVPEISFQHLTALCNSSMASSSKPIVLHIGDPVKWNTELFAKFSEDFTVIRPSTEERQRDEFKKALREKRWGDFSAIFRPFWNTGGEMGNWDKELIPLLPASCKIFASAGAGFDWVHVDLLAARGMHFHLFSGIRS
jgi:hypothetical protein